MKNNQDETPKKPKIRKQFLLGRHDRYAYLDADQLVNELGIGSRTARRFVKEPDNMPGHYRELLEYKVLGIVPGMPEATSIDGHIWVDHRYKFNIEQLRNITLMYETQRSLGVQIAELRAENHQLKAYIKTIDNVIPFPDTDITMPQESKKRPRSRPTFRA